MRTTLDQEFLHGPSLGSGEEKIACVAIVKVDLGLTLGLLHKVCFLKVSRMFGVVSIEIADSVRGLSVGTPPKIALNRNLQKEEA